MYYITAMQPPRYYQMSVEELLFEEFDNKKSFVSMNIANTKTDCVEKISRKIRSTVDVSSLIRRLIKFNEATQELRAAERRSLYHSFKIPKRSGGLRQIDAPNDELMTALRTLKTTFEQDFHALYHTSAFAYVSNRSTIDAVKRHQQNESRWFCKLDLHDFFGSITKEFLMRQLAMIFPFNEVIEIPIGREEMEKAIDLALLDGGLPQGTPLSPTLTNIMMIPIDYVLTKKLRNYSDQKFVYTRYADDFIISSRYDFDYREIESLVIEILNSFGAPFTINEKKTRYGSSAGRNFILGVMLNKDNQITIGNKKKKQFKSMLYNYINDQKKGIAWSVSDIQTVVGLYSYYHMVEGDAIDKLVAHVSGTQNSDNIINIMKAAIAC